jgi:hypothetical protein
MSKKISAFSMAFAILSQVASPATASEINDFNINSFDKPAKSVTYGEHEHKNNTLKQDTLSNNKLSSMFELKSLNQNTTYEITDILKNNRAGVYQNPTDNDEIMVLTFKENKDEVNLNKIKEELKNSKNFNNDDWKLLKDAYYTAMNHRITSSHTPYLSEKKDYNTIYIKQEGDQFALELSIKEKLTEHDQEMHSLATYFHEQGHSHVELKDTLGFIEQIDQMEKNGTINDSNISTAMEYLEGTYSLDESYSDSFSTITMAKFFKEKYGSEEGKDKYDNFYEQRYEMRNKTINKFNLNSFQKHFTATTISSTDDFINLNWNKLDNMNFDDIKSVATYISKHSMDNKHLIRPLTTPEGQKHYSQEIIDGKFDKTQKNISNSINIELMKMNGDFSILNNKVKVLDIKSELNSFISRKSKSTL